MTLIATNKLTPTGGVTCPIARLTVATIPKATKSYPSALQNGSIIGIKIYIAEFASIKHPAIKKITFTIKRCATLESRLDAACEIPNLVHTNENKEAHATISMIPPVVFADSTKISTKSLNFTSR